MLCWFHWRNMRGPFMYVLYINEVSIVRTHMYAYIYCHMYIRWHHLYVYVCSHSKWMPWEQWMWADLWGNRELIWMSVSKWLSVRQQWKKLYRLIIFCLCVCVCVYSLLIHYSYWFLQISMSVLQILMNVTIHALTALDHMSANAEVDSGYQMMDIHA